MALKKVRKVISTVAGFLMSSLGQQQQKASYPSLLQVPGGITSSLQTVTDGNGNATALSISTTQVSGLSVVSNTTNNINGGAAGSLPYQSALNTTSFLAPGTAGQVLQCNGSSAPSWVNAPGASTANVLDYGASPSASAATNTTAFQAAFNTGKLVYVPKGLYYVNPGITTTGAGMVGDGPKATLIVVSGTFSTNIITWNGVGGPGVYGPMFRDFTLQTNVYSQTAGALLSVYPSSGEVQGTFIQNVYSNSGYDGISLNNAPHFKVIGCYISNASRAGIFVQNVVDVDSGDSSITSCTFGAGFYSSDDEQAGVLQYSSGGLKITSCKFLGGNHGYFMNAVLPTKGVGDLIIANCSIETNKYAGIKFRRKSGSYGWGGIVINGNQIGTPTAAEATNSWCLIANDSSGFLNDIVISGNTFGVHNSNNSLGIDYNQDIYITANKFYAVGGSPASAGIQIGANALYCRVDYNDYRNFPTPVNTSSSSVWGTGWNQKGLATGVVSNSPYGSLYIGSVAVTFPQVFPPSAIPNVTVTIAGGSAGGVSAWVQNVTNTGFNLYVIAVNNGVNSTDVFWSAELEQFPF